MNIGTKNLLSVKAISAKLLAQVPTLRDVSVLAEDDTEIVGITMAAAQRMGRHVLIRLGDGRVYQAEASSFKLLWHRFYATSSMGEADKFVEKLPQIYVA